MTTEYTFGDWTRAEVLYFLGLVGVDDPKVAALSALSWGGNALKVLRVNATENGWELVAAAPLTDGDKGDIVVSSSGSVFSFDSSVVTAFARTILDDASAGDVRSTLDLVIGTHVQAYDADLTTWAGITPGTGVGTALAVNVGSAGAFVTFNGAGGTPSSLTLTNATGLPIAGLVASTSAALGIGSIELGHGSDTTIARSGAGDISIEGNAVYRAGGTDVPVTDGGTGASTASGARTNLGLGTIATQDASAVAITGGTIAGISSLGVGGTPSAASTQLFATAAGAGSDGLAVTQSDSTFGNAHTSRFITQQQGSGIGRTLFYAASPTTGNTRGQFDCVTENGGNFLWRFGYAATGSENSFDFYNIAGSVAIRLHASGSSYLNGGNVGINETSPDYKLDVNGSFGFTPGSSVTPIDNGDVVFELTNNTTLTIKAKGSDGTVRTATITLA